MAATTTSMLSAVSNLLGGNASAKTIAKSNLSKQSQGFVGSLLGTSDTSNISAAGNALIARTHNRIDARRKTLTAQGEAVLNASDLIAKAGTGGKAALAALQNLRKIAAEAADAGTTPTRRTELQQTFAKKLADYTTTINAVQRDGKPILTGTQAPVTVNVGAEGRRDTLQLTFPDLSARGLRIDKLSVDSAAGAESAVGQLDAAVRTTTSAYSRLQQHSTRLERSADTLIAALTQIGTMQNALAGATAASQAQKTSGNDLLSAFLPSSSLAGSAQILL